MKISDNVKNKTSDYIRKFVKNMTIRSEPVFFLNRFDYDKGTTTIIDKLLEDGYLYGADTKTVISDEFYEYLYSYLKKTMPAYFLSELRSDMSLDDASKFIQQKGTQAYHEFNGYQQPIAGEHPQERKATEKQIDCLKMHVSSLKHADELTSREASALIKNLSDNNKTKPFYFTYYTGKGKNS